MDRLAGDPDSAKSVRGAPRVCGTFLPHLVKFFAVQGHGRLALRQRVPYGALPTLFGRAPSNHPGSGPCPIPDYPETGTGPPPCVSPVRTHHERLLRESGTATLRKGVWFFWTS